MDFEAYHYSAGSSIFVQKDQVHAFLFSPDCKGYLLLFTQQFLDQVHINMRLPNNTPTHLSNSHSPLLTPDSETRRRCHTLIKEIIAETNHVETDPLIIMYLFSSLSLILHRLRPEMRHDKLSPEQSAKLSSPSFLSYCRQALNKLEMPTGMQRKFIQPTKHSTN